MYQIVKKIEATSSTKEKLAILQANKDNDDLKTFFYYCLNPYITFGIKKIPSRTLTNESMTLKQFITNLDRFIERRVTGNAAIECLEHMLSCLSDEDYDLAVRIIKRDPDCGVAEKTVNKVWKDMIPIYPTMLCSAFDEKLIKKLDWDSGVIVDRKEDGLRINIIQQDGITTVRTRAGQELHVNGHFDAISVDGMVIDGEMLFYGKDGKVLSRKEGNGLGNKCNRGTISDEEISRAFIVAWDVIPLKDFLTGYCAVPLKERVQKLHELYKQASNKRFQVTESALVKSFEEANKIFVRYLEDGIEGAILKDPESPWEDTRSKRHIKLKDVRECDLKIVGFEDGKDKIEGLMGALICSTSDDLLQVNVGGGFTVYQRAWYMANWYNRPVQYVTVSDGEETIHTVPPEGVNLLGKILPTKYNAAIKAEDGSWSLFLPRASNGDIRYDKKVADSLGQL